MTTLAGRALREAYRRELLPARARWWLAATGMRDWFRILAKGLTPHLPAPKDVLARHALRVFRRRAKALDASHPALRLGSSDVRLADFMAALYRVNVQSAWVFGALGPVDFTVPARVRRELALRSLRAPARWEELTVHLGDLLIVLTEDLPAELPHARKILGDICFEAGARFAKHATRAFGIVTDEHDPAKTAIEVLRMSEYVFRVNPQHWSETKPSEGRGSLEGTACPWFAEPGWNGGHCGIFGQFQAGISSEFGLKYHLAKTIPKHGGSTCRVDLKPIVLRRSRDDQSASG